MHTYFHLPAKYIVDPLELAAYFESQGFQTSHDRDSGRVDLATDHRLICFVPRPTRIFANLVVAVIDPDTKTEAEDSATVLDPFHSHIENLGGTQASRDFQAELDFIGRKYSNTRDLNDLIEETRHHHANVAHHVAAGDFESAVHHRDLRDASMIKIVDACKFYD